MGSFARLDRAVFDDAPGVSFGRGQLSSVCPAAPLRGALHMRPARLESVESVAAHYRSWEMGLAVVGSAAGPTGAGPRATARQKTGVGGQNSGHGHGSTSRVVK